MVGIAGVEGMRQSDLGTMRAGLASPSSGRLFIAGREVTGHKPKAITAAGAGIVPEDRHASACILDMSVAENLFLGNLGRFSAFGLVRRSAITETAADLMRSACVRAPHSSAPIHHPPHRIH